MVRSMIVWLLLSVISSYQLCLIICTFSLFCFMQLECRWRRRTGRHSSHSSTTTLLMRYQPMCRSCSILHSRAGLVCLHGTFCCINDLIVVNCFFI